MFLKLSALTMATPALAKLPAGKTIAPAVTDFSDYPGAPSDWLEKGPPFGEVLDLSSGHGIHIWSVTEEANASEFLDGGIRQHVLLHPTSFTVTFETSDPQIVNAIRNDFMGHTPVTLKLLARNGDIKVLATGTMGECQFSATFDSPLTLNGTMYIYDDADVRFVS